MAALHKEGHMTDGCNALSECSADLAFIRCLYAAAMDEDFVTEFCRLRHVNKKRFFHSPAARKRFAQFVFEVMYCRLSDEELTQLRKVAS